MCQCHDFYRMRRITNSGKTYSQCSTPVLVFRWVGGSGHFVSMPGSRSCIFSHAHTDATHRDDSKSQKLWFQLSMRWSQTTSHSDHDAQGRCSSVFHLRLGPFRPEESIYIFLIFALKVFKALLILRIVHAGQKMLFRQAVTNCRKAMTSEENDVAWWLSLKFLLVLTPPQKSTLSGSYLPWTMESTMAQWWENCLSL